MSNYSVRPLTSTDFAAIMLLEHTIFGDDPPGVLGPYYVRICCDVYSDSCFIVVDETTGEPVGYLLSFIKGREVHCTTLAILPAHQRSRAIALLLRAFVQRVIDEVEVCWFTVTPDNTAARALHATLGAREVATHIDYYGPGDQRIASCIDAERFDTLRARYEKLGLVRTRPRAVPGVALEATP